MKNIQSTYASTFGTLGPDTSGCPVECVPELIRKRAYQLFESRGRQPGHELDDWLQAEREIKPRMGL